LHEPHSDVIYLSTAYLSTEDKGKGTHTRNRA